MVNFWIGEGETKTLYRGEWPDAQPSDSEALYIRKSSLYIKPEAEVVDPAVVRKNYLDAVNAMIAAENHLKELLIKEGLLNE